MMMDLEAQEDNYLVELVKTNGDESALFELMERHSGVFHTTVNNFLPPSFSDSERRDVFDEKPTMFFEAIRSYQDDKNTKFVTWLANKTRYNLLSRRSKEASKPIFCEYEERDDQRDSPLIPYDYVVQKDELEEIFKLVFDKYGSEVYLIMKDKYFGGPKGSGKTFSEIANDLGISPQAVQVKHKTAIQFLKRKLK